LYGGIQRYLEQFPDGGYFDGKNFVFDHRSVPYKSAYTLKLFALAVPRVLDLFHGFTESLWEALKTTYLELV
jgi:hypothetical protein